MEFYKVKLFKLNGNLKVIMLELKEKLNAFIIILNKIAPVIG